jgi:hypothetical protein
VSLKEQVRELADIAIRNAGAPDPKAAIVRDMRDSWRKRARRHGTPLSEAAVDDILATDLELNAQGLVVWLGRQKRAV